jgi:hypothetical protein
LIYPDVDGHVGFLSGFRRERERLKAPRDVRCQIKRDLGRICAELLPLFRLRAGTAVLMPLNIESNHIPAFGQESFGPSAKPAE